MLMKLISGRHYFTTRCKLAEVTLILGQVGHSKAVLEYSLAHFLELVRFTPLCKTPGTMLIFGLFKKLIS